MMPEFSGFWQWAGWVIIFAMVLSTLDNMVRNFSRRGG